MGLNEARPADVRVPVRAEVVALEALIDFHVESRARVHAQHAMKCRDAADRHLAVDQAGVDPRWISELGRQFMRARN